MLRLIFIMFVFCVAVYGLSASFAVGPGEKTASGEETAKSKSKSGFNRTQKRPLPTITLTRPANSTTIAALKKVRKARRHRVKSGERAIADAAAARYRKKKQLEQKKLFASSDPVSFREKKKRARRYSMHENQNDAGRIKAGIIDFRQEVLAKKGTGKLRNIAALKSQRRRSLSTSTKEQPVKREIENTWTRSATVPYGTPLLAAIDDDGEVSLDDVEPRLTEPAPLGEDSLDLSGTWDSTTLDDSWRSLQDLNMTRTLSESLTPDLGETMSFSGSDFKLTTESSFDSTREKFRKVIDAAEAEPGCFSKRVRTYLMGVMLDGSIESIQDEMQTLKELQPELNDEMLESLLTRLVKVHEDEKEFQEVVEAFDSAKEILGLDFTREAKEYLITNLDMWFNISPSGSFMLALKGSLHHLMPGLNRAALNEFLKIPNYRAWKLAVAGSDS